MILMFSTHKGCNLAQIRKTGVDPCNAGSIKSPQPIEMGCHGGNNWLDIPSSAFVALAAASDA